MSSNEERRFYFHAEGHAFSGVFHRPVSVPIETLASVSLPTIGGHAHTRIENFHIPRLVSFKSAHTHVSGSQQDVDTFTTQVTTTIEGLRILDFLTADRIVCRLTSEHLRKNKEGHILAIGSHFENLRLGGYPVEVKLRHDLFIDCKTFDDLKKRITKGPKSGTIPPATNEAALCSLAEKIQTDLPGADSCVKLKRGDLNDALTQADAGLRNFSSPDTEWHWRFTVLKGEILARQRRKKESLELLAQDLPPSLASSDVAVWRKLAQGLSNGLSGEFSESARLLGDAEKLAKLNHLDLLGEVALRKGTVGFLLGDNKAASAAFHMTLEIAREQKDSFLEANALGSLGLVATKQEHYDEAIDWFRAASQLSQSVGARSAAAKTIGNLGWSYFEMGDYQNARTLFQRAEASSGSVGLVGDQVYWQTNLGVSDYFLHDYAKAEKESQTALELAKKMGQPDTIAECLNNLSELALQGGQLDLAERYNREAEGLSPASDSSPSNLPSVLIEGRIEGARRHFTQAEKFLKKVIRDPTAETALRWEAEARLARVYDDERQPAQAERQYRLALGTIDTARKSLQQDEFRLTFLSSSIEAYQDYVDFLVDHSRPKDAHDVASLRRPRTPAEGFR